MFKFGDRAINTRNNEEVIVIKTYNLEYVDAPEKMGAHVVNKKSKVYPIAVDALKAIK